MVNTRGPRTQDSAAKKDQLVGTILAGKKIAQAARMFDMPWTTANNIWKKYRESGNTENQH